MNNEWNSEVVTEVSDVDITVDQAYNASSENPQSGTAVAGAIEGVKQLPASTSADATKVLTVDSSGVPGWAQAASGGATWTTTQYTTGATVNQGHFYIPMDDPIPLKAGVNLFAIWFRVPLSVSPSSNGIYLITVSVGSYADINVPVSLKTTSTEAYGEVVSFVDLNSVPSVLPQEIILDSTLQFDSSKRVYGYVAVFN